MIRWEQDTLIQARGNCRSQTRRGLERQREGIQKAKAEGKYRGRKPTARAKAEEIKQLADEGLSMGQIAARLGIGKGSIHRAVVARPSA